MQNKAKRLNDKSKAKMQEANFRKAPAILEDVSDEDFLANAYLDASDIDFDEQPKALLLQN